IKNALLVDGLKHTLLSISQLCDKGFSIVFEHDACLILDSKTKEIIFKGTRKNNVYELYLDELPSLDEKCFVISNEVQWLWHKRLGHVNFKMISKLSKYDLVRGLPKISFKKDHLCDACQKGKQVKSSFKANDIVSTRHPLELLHLDLFGPSR
ncbi:GAG-pre-integrase domain-containing protein, partial [Klebsiella pneumoniae]|uniref:GAG-pre-integrase domain-containing protein n=1 Tax=Klebsiella pneumoniae TaxID=573 RepID=UPI003531E3F7